MGPRAGEGPWRVTAEALVHSASRLALPLYTVKRIVPSITVTECPPIHGPPSA